MKKKLLFGSTLFIIGAILAVPLTPFFVTWLTSRFTVFQFTGFSESLGLIFHSEPHFTMYKVLILLVLVAILIFLLFQKSSKSVQTMTVADEITIPVAVGDGQHGTASFIPEKNFKEHFDTLTINRADTLINTLIRTGKEDIEYYEKMEAAKEIREQYVSFFRKELEKNKSSGLYDEATITAMTTEVRKFRDLLAKETDRNRMEQVLSSSLAELNSYLSQKEIRHAVLDYEDEIHRYIEELLLKENLPMKTRHLLQAEKAKTVEEFKARFAVRGAKTSDIDLFIANEKNRLLRLSCGVLDEMELQNSIFQEVREMFDSIPAVEFEEDPSLRDFRENMEEAFQYVLTVDEMKALREEVSGYIEDRFGTDVKYKDCPSPEITAESVDPPITEVPQGNYLKNAGIILGKDRKKTKIDIFYASCDESHSVFIGSTGAGKTRRIVLPTIGALGLAGESMILTDPKGELFKYTGFFLKKLGFKVNVLDFDQPHKSDQYNFLQPIIDALNENDLPEAETAVWDIVNILTPENSHNEKIWTYGEQSILAACIMAVVYDNRDKPQYQNLGNVYYFLSEMVKSYNNTQPIEFYIQSLPMTHPARRLLAIAEVSPSKTRASFYAGALTTLRLFTSEALQGMTSRSDIDPGKIGMEKTALFIVLPDDRSTFYSMALLLVKQFYTSLVKTAKRYGDELPVRVNFLLDEFGNFTKIIDFDQMMTVARSRRMRFNMFLQSFSQIDEKYGEKNAITILNQCANSVYLAANNDETLEKFSKKLGSYTVNTYSSSHSANTGHRSTGGTQSSSWNMASRNLLYASEIGKIKPPYLLLHSSKKDPAVMYCPDLNETCWAEMFGMGTIEENNRLRQLREKYRPQRTITDIQIDRSWKKWIHMAQKN